MIKLYNTLTNQKEEFQSIEPNKVKMYVCGPTVYNYIHVGNARSTVVFDTIRRYLEFRGYEVEYISNFTDVDDKVIRVAKETDQSVEAVAEKYIQAFFDDTSQLNVKRATAHPRVMNHIEDIIQFIEELIQKGYAYEADGDVYFRTDRFKDYGKLSDQSIEDLRHGASERTNEDDNLKKESPIDFALWKNVKPGEISWKSPWGAGRPGWHIECSVMAGHYLGKTIDIHAGGHDLTFPHHENEIAQSEARNGAKFANYWLHNGFVTTAEGEKMSKSLGNFMLLHDLVKQFDPLVIRFYLATAHYRHPLVFNTKTLEEAQTNLERFRTTIHNIDYRLESASEGETIDFSDYMNRFIIAMDDDFNAPNALAVLHEFSRQLNTLVSSESVSKNTLEAGRRILTELLDVFGIVIEGTKELLDEEVQQLIDQRLQARAEKDFAKSDAIRDQLKEQGIILEDTPQGTRWKRG
ncbi:cysteine--tRNA ligase [Atopobacter phocae]|uniref:cysteine--tRNA ligase n=1 Tax=Atopobacter phocae TaxID=136492 RepID=UPI00046EB610|nr:cysteine--tRNA ligase [Atopobacter phocae]